ncbi:hypothetical protein OH77DRAFT_551424 [Trametes cingulata]|nr:hypothetical protein OH77DRAFT_551424 [Trametes cingulata]
MPSISSNGYAVCLAWRQRGHPPSSCPRATWSAPSFRHRRRAAMWDARRSSPARLGGGLVRRGLVAHVSFLIASPPSAFSPFQIQAPVFSSAPRVRLDLGPPPNRAGGHQAPHFSFVSLELPTSWCGSHRALVGALARTVGLAPMLDGSRRMHGRFCDAQVRPRRPQHTQANRRDPISLRQRSGFSARTSKSRASPCLPFSRSAHGGEHMSGKAGLARGNDDG